MRIIKLMTILAVLSLALLGLNCSDSESPESAIPQKFVGTWKAELTKVGTLIEYAPQADPESGVDLRLLGAAITATLNNDGTYSLTFVDPTAEEPDTDQGKVVIDEENNTLLLDSDAGSEDDVPFAYQWVDDNTLTLVTLAEFDFTLQGNPPVPAIVTIILKRSP